MFLLLFTLIFNSFSQENFEEKFSQYLKLNNGQVEEANLDEFIAKLFPDTFPTNATMISSRSTQKDAVNEVTPRRLISLGDRNFGGTLKTPNTFIGASPGKNELELMVWNEKENSYDFFLVENFGPGKTPKLIKPHKGECMQCHQNGGPIFTPFPWGESAFNNNQTNDNRTGKLLNTPRSDEEKEKIKFFFGESDLAFATGGFDFDNSVRSSSKLLQEKSFNCEDLCPKGDSKCEDKLFKLSILSLSTSDPQSRAEFIKLLKDNPEIYNRVTYPTSVLAERDIDQMGGKFVRVQEIIGRDEISDNFTPVDLSQIKFLHSLETASFIPPTGFKVKSVLKSIDDTNGPGHPAFPRDRVGLGNISNTLGTCNKFSDKQKAELLGFPFEYMLSALNQLNPKTSDDPAKVVASIFDKISQIVADPDKYLGQCQVDNLNPLNQTVSDDLSLILSNLEKNMKPRPIQDPLDPEGDFMNLDIFEIFDDKGQRVGWRRNVMTLTDCSHGSCKPINFDIILDKDGNFLKYEEIKTGAFEFTKINHTPFTKSDHDRLHQLIKTSLEKSPETISKKDDYIDAVSGATKLTSKDEVVPLAAYTTNKVIDYIKSTMMQVKNFR